MAISKRIRFEVLRRDGFRCTYCGASPTEAELHVDHVMPVALGGTDLPNNLTTSCADCNLGKASTSPDESLIAEVDRAAAAVAAAKARASELAVAHMAEFDAYEGRVVDIWHYRVPKFRRSYTQYPDLARIDSWFRDGVPLELVEKAVRIAVAASHVSWTGKADYASGVIRNTMRELGEVDGA